MEPRYDRNCLRVNHCESTHSPADLRVAELTLDPYPQVGILLAGCVLPLQEKAYHRATVNGAYPEARLYPMMVGSVVLPIALFIFAFTGGYAWVHWMGVMVAGSLFGFAMITIYVSANS